MKPLHLPSYPALIEEQSGRSVIYDVYRQSMVALTPEEWVRQHFLHYLSDHLGYPRLSIQVESLVANSIRQDRFDAMIYGPGGRVLALIECKAPEVPLSQETVNQISRYNAHYHAPLLMMTNGLTHLVLQIDYATATAKPLAEIPSYQRALDILQISKGLTSNL